MKFKYFANKEQMYLVFKNKGIDYKYIRFKDCENNIDYAYLWMIDDYNYSQDVVGGIKSINVSNFDTEVIDSMKKIMGLIEINDNGMLYELDVYPVFKDFIKFPITDIEVLDEEEVIRYKMKNFIK